MLFPVLRGIGVAMFGLVCCFVGGMIANETAMFIMAYVFLVATVWIGVERIVQEIRKLRADVAPTRSPVEPNGPIEPTA